MQSYDISLFGVDFRVYDTPQSLTVPFALQEMRTSQDLKTFKDLKYVVDLGAHVGMWGMCMGFLYPEANILCVEPDVTNFDNLNKGITYNRIKNVRGLNCAASSRPGNVVLKMDESNTGSNSILLNEGSESPCVALALNNIIDQRVDLLKIDIEGMEFGLFNGFKRWDNVMEMSIEVHPWLFSRGKDLVDEFCQFLRSEMEDKPIYVTSSDLKYHRGYLR